MGKIYASCGHQIPSGVEPCLYDHFGREGAEIAWGVLCERCKLSHIIFNNLEQGLEWLNAEEKDTKSKKASLKEEAPQC